MEYRGHRLDYGERRRTIGGQWTVDEPRRIIEIG